MCERVYKSIHEEIIDNLLILGERLRSMAPYEASREAMSILHKAGLVDENGLTTEPYRRGYGRPSMGPPLGKV